MCEKQLKYYRTPWRTKRSSIGQVVQTVYEAVHLILSEVYSHPSVNPKFFYYFSELQLFLALCLFCPFKVKACMKSPTGEPRQVQFTPFSRRWPKALPHNERKGKANVGNWIFLDCIQAYITYVFEDDRF